MSFSSAIQPEINLFYGHYGLGTRTQQSFREIEWAMESNLLKCETHEMICVAETPESIVTLRAPSSGYGFTNATRGSPSERGHGRENTFRTIDIVQEKTTLREGSSWRTVRERERERGRCPRWVRSAFRWHVRACPQDWHAVCVSHTCCAVGRSIRRSITEHRHVAVYLEAVPRPRETWRRGPLSSLVQWNLRSLWYRCPGSGLASGRFKAAERDENKSVQIL